MRVLHVIETLGIGGAEVLLAHALPRLGDKGFDVRIRSLIPPDTLVKPLRDGNVDAAVLGDGGLHVKRDILRHAYRLRAYLERNPVDIVHTHLLHASLAARVALMTMRRRPRLVSSLHSPEGQWAPEAGRLRTAGRGLVDWASGLLMNDAFVAVTPSVREEFQARLGKRGAWGKMHVIYNALDVDGLSRDVAAVDRNSARTRFGWKPDDFAILSIGRLNFQKNFEALIDATRRLRERGVNARSVVIGDGPDKASLLRRASESGSPVEFIGRVDRDGIAQALAACDVYVQYSRFEGFGLAVLEAMIAKKPVVASRVEGIVWVVDDGATGRLVSSPGEFVDEIERFSKEPALRARLGGAGYERAKSLFGLDKWVTDTIALYRHVCGEVEAQSGQRGHREVIA